MKTKQELEEIIEKAKEQFERTIATPSFELRQMEKEEEKQRLLDTCGKFFVKHENHWNDYYKVIDEELNCHLVSVRDSIVVISFRESFRGLDLDKNGHKEITKEEFDKQVEKAKEKLNKIGETK